MTEFDAIVIGGGPSGSTAGALLAEQGHKVLLLEREPFPRYHIGESLIPYTWFTLNRLGVVDWLRQSACPKKYSVQFVSITGKVSQPFYFFQTIKHECAQTWQVWRGEFDQMLLDNAVKKGVELRQFVSVRDVLMEGSRVVGVRADTKDGAKGEEIRAKVVDRRVGPRFPAVPQVRLEGQGRGPQQDRRLELLRGRAARPGPRRGRDHRRLRPAEGLVLVHPAPLEHRQRRRRRRTQLSVPRHARPGGDLPPRGRSLRVDSRSHQGRQAGAAGPRHR